MIYTELSCLIRYITVIYHSKKVNSFSFQIWVILEAKNINDWVIDITSLSDSKTRFLKPNINLRHITSTIMMAHFQRELWKLLCKLLPTLCPLGLKMISLSVSDNSRDTDGFSCLGDSCREAWGVSLKDNEVVLLKIHGNVCYIITNILTAV